MSGAFDLRGRFGISTLALKDLPLEKAIDAVENEGFGAFELVPQVYGGPESIDQDTRRRLSERLARFDVVTIHSSVAKLKGGREANIASPEIRHRFESIQLYLSHVELALDIGARIVTFHPGNGDAKTPTGLVPEANSTFAQRALEQIEGCDLLIAYECFDMSLVKKIGDPRFGILFDIGHAAMGSSGDSNETILRLMEQLFPFILQFHVHGVRVSGQGVKKDHQPLQLNNAVDYARIIQAIKGEGCSCPLVFEIGISTEQDVVQNLKDAVYAREELVALWEKC